MAKLKFDEVGTRLYETGVSKGVLFVQDENGAYPKGVAWNGLTAVNESPSGAEANDQYADNIKYLSLTGAENFEGTIEAFSSPVEFDQCDGMVEIATGINAHQQTRKAFGFAYQTVIGNDVKQNDYGVKLHILYGCKASPTERSYSTINDSPEPANPSWSITSTPVDVPGHKPTSVLTIDSTRLEPSKWEALIGAIYGTDNSEPYLPSPKQIIDLVA